MDSFVKDALAADQDIERAFQYAVTAILSAVGNLRAHALIGRRIEGRMRELVISCERAGHVALYRFTLSRWRRCAFLRTPLCWTLSKYRISSPLCTFRD